MRNRIKTAILAGALGLAVLVASVPQAQAQTRQRGMMFRLGIGASGCTDLVCEGLDASGQFKLQALYRVVPYFAVGVHWAWMFVDPDRNRPDVDLGWATTIGLEIRGILPVGKLEAFIAMSLGFMHQQLEGSPGNVVFDVQRSDSFALGMGFGFDYYMVRQVALGLQFFLYNPFVGRDCSDLDPVTVCRDLNDDEKEQYGIIWTLGLNVTFFLPL